MRIILSRKGFDSAAGGCPSPIIAGVPVSLPIPGPPSEPFRYSDLTHPLIGPLGPVIAALGRDADGHAHADPVLPAMPGPAALGQHGAAQTHLLRHRVGRGDVFVFFGLFRDETGWEHHRIFGMMRVTGRLDLAHPASRARVPHRFANHPHLRRPDLARPNGLWLGEGRLAHHALPELVLTRPGAKPSSWRVPAWLGARGLSYHAAAWRWGAAAKGEVELQAVSRGQEFICDIGAMRRPREWLARVWDRMGPDRGP